MLAARAGDELADMEFIQFHPTALDIKISMQSQRLPLVSEAVRGEGATVWDADGQAYTDLLAGIAVNVLGHAHPRLVQAVTEQLGTLGHISNLFTSLSQIALAERLLELAQAPAGSTVFFANSGTEANETALLLAAYARRSDQVLAMRQSYHGRSFGATGVTGNRAWTNLSYRLCPCQTMEPGHWAVLPLFWGYTTGRRKVDRGCVKPAWSSTTCSFCL